MRVVDEILELFKGRTVKIQLIPSQRVRFSMKVFIAAEGKTSYIVNFEIYVRNSTDYTAAKNWSA